MIKITPFKDWVVSIIDCDPRWGSGSGRRFPFQISLPLFELSSDQVPGYALIKGCLFMGKINYTF